MAGRCMYSFLAATALSVLATISFPEPAQAGRGYFVIVSSVPVGGRFDVQSARATRDCGYVVDEATTYRGSGFRPGYNVLFLGPYPSSRHASRVLRRVRYCVPDAYVKWGDL